MVHLTTNAYLETSLLEGALNPSLIWAAPISSIGCDCLNYVAVAGMGEKVRTKKREGERREERERKKEGIYIYIYI
jgi:hypothetical protein